MLSNDERDVLVNTVSELTTMNHIMNEQAKRIENHNGILWKTLSNEEKNEPRYYAYGVTNTGLLCQSVVYCYSGDHIRIIGGRKLKR